MSDGCGRYTRIRCSAANNRLSFGKYALIAVQEKDFHNVIFKDMASSSTLEWVERERGGRSAFIQCR